jgi:signal peptidase
MMAKRSNSKKSTTSASVEGSTSESNISSEAVPSDSSKIATATNGSTYESNISSEVVPSDSSKFASVLKWLRRIVSSVLVLAVLAVASVASIALIHGTWQVNPVVSGSMRPGLSVGGIVISEQVPVSQLALRDVIEFKNPTDPSDLMVHRIVVMTKNKSGQLVIKTQGDANNAQDPWTLTISGNDAYVVRWSLPLLGYVAVAYQNNRGFVLLAVGIILISLAATTIGRPRRRGKKRHVDDKPDPKDPLDAAASSSTNETENATVALNVVTNDALSIDSSS